MREVNIPLYGLKGSPLNSDDQKAREGPSGGISAFPELLQLQDVRLAADVKQIRYIAKRSTFINRGCIT